MIHHRILAALAQRTGNVDLYRRSKPSGRDFAAFLKRHRVFHAIGADCYVSTIANITDPKLVSIGDNVLVGDCTIFCHDGSINMVNAMHGSRLDSVGPVRIGSNVFLGYQCVIMPGVTIGDGVIIGAGAVVGRNVPSNSIMVGSPAKRIGALSTHVANMRRRHASYPWAKLIEARAAEFDPVIEPELVRQRALHFFGAA